MKKTILYLIMITFLAAPCGCGKKPSPDDKVLVKVSNSFITVNDFRSRIAKLPSYYQSIVEKNKKRYLEDIIVEKLFYEEAVRKGLGEIRWPCRLEKVLDEPPVYIDVAHNPAGAKRLAEEFVESGHAMSP